MQLGRSLAAFDAFVKTKVGSAARKRTACGAILTVCAFVVASGLILSELGLYYTSEMESTLGVDRSEGAEHLSIVLDVSFWHLPCKDVELEVQDAKGRLYNPRRARVSKRDLPAGAEPGREGGYGMFGGGGGGGGKEGKRGCRLNGAMDVNRVAGNFHIVPRAFSAKGGLSMYRGMPLEDLLHYNASHTIHHLRFGQAFPGQKNPLDGTTVGDPKPSQFQYFLQVVPTRYEHLTGLVTEGHQISSTFHTAPSDPTSPYMVPPGFVVRFDLSPIIVTLSSASPGIGRLLTGICAVVGGVYAVTAMLDKAIHGGIAVMAKVD